MPVHFALASGVSDSLNLSERYAHVKCARLGGFSLPQAHDFSCETLGGTGYGSVDEGCLSAVATGRVLMLDQCRAAREVYEGIGRAVRTRGRRG